MGSPCPLLLDRHDVCDTARGLDLLLCRGTVCRSVHCDRPGQLAGSQDLKRELILATTCGASRGDERVSVRVSAWQESFQTQGRRGVLKFRIPLSFSISNEISPPSPANLFRSRTLIVTCIPNSEQRTSKNESRRRGVEGSAVGNQTTTHVIWKTMPHASRNSSELGQLSVKRRLSTLKSRADATPRTTLLSTHSVSRCASLSGSISPSLPRLLAPGTLLGAQIVQPQPLGLVLSDTLHHGHPCSPRRLHASLDPHANKRRGLDPVNSDDALHRTTCETTAKACACEVSWDVLFEAGGRVAGERARA